MSINSDDNNEKKKSCCCSLKGMPCELKLAYVLIVLSLLLSVFAITCKTKTGDLSNKKIAEWVKNNPSPILDSLNTYIQEQQKQAADEQRKKSTENIAKYKKDLSDSKTAFVLNKDAKKEIVEFFDYNCGYCKMAFKNVDELLKNNKNVRLVLRPIPIFGERSKYATEMGTAIILSEPTKYYEYYAGLMNSSAGSKESVDNVIKSINLDVAKLEAFIKNNDTAVKDFIKNNLDLAQNIGVNGTPAFIINGKDFIPGAVDTKTLESYLK